MCSSFSDRACNSTISLKATVINRYTKIVEYVKPNSMVPRAAQIKVNDSNNPICSLKGCS